MSMEQMSGQPMRIEGPSQTPDFGAPGNPYESVNPANNPAEKDLAQAPGYYHEEPPKPVDPTAETQTDPNGPVEPPKPPSDDFDNSGLVPDGFENRMDEKDQERYVGKVELQDTPFGQVASNTDGNTAFNQNQMPTELPTKILAPAELGEPNMNATDAPEYKV